MPPYKHGLYFEPVLAQNLRELQDRVNKKKASLIIIDGGVGLGKTTLLIHVLDYINHLNGKPPVQIETEKGEAGPQLAMGGVEFLKKLKVCYEENLPCIGYDEAGDFSKRGSLTKFNAMLNRTFETFRAFKCIVILALPNFNVLDNQLFDNQIPRMLIHVTDRSMNYGNFDAFDLMCMNWARYWMKKMPVKNYAWTKVYPNFRGQFLDLEPDRSKMLDRISMKNKLKILAKSQIKIEGLLGYADMATKLEMSVIWVRKACANLGLKHARIVDRIKYFDPDVVNRLADHLEDTMPEGQRRGRPKRSPGRHNARRPTKRPTKRKQKQKGPGR
jgi:hypothetical protein